MGLRKDLKKRAKEALESSAFRRICRRLLYEKL